MRKIQLLSSVYIMSVMLAIPCSSTVYADQVAETVAMETTATEQVQEAVPADETVIGKEDYGDEEDESLSEQELLESSLYDEANSKLIDNSGVDQYGNPIVETPVGDIQETLSEAQVAAGYQLIDGHAVAPKDLHYGGVQPSTNTGVITVIATAPSYCHDNIYVTVINRNTSESFQVALFEVNGWKMTMNLPVGYYVLQNAGFTTDTTNQFYADNQSFEVKKGGANVLTIKMKDSAKATDTAETVPNNEAVDETNESASETVSGIYKTTNAAVVPDFYDGLKQAPLGSETEKTKVNIVNIVFVLACLLIPFAALYVMKHKNHSDE